MRPHSRTIPRAVVATLVILAAPAARPNAAGVARNASAEALLERARERLGGTAALDAVKSLILRRDDHLTERILFPDRRQVILSTAWGDLVRTFDGTRHWVRMPKLPANLPDPHSRGDSLSSVDAVRATRHTIAELSLKYLLRVPAGTVMGDRYGGLASFGSAAGPAVGFSAPDGHWVLLVFDASTAFPKAMVRRASGDPAIYGTHVIEELRDYRPAGMTQVPAQIATYRLRLGEIEALAVWRFTVTVNPPLSRDDFLERPGGTP